MPQNENPTLEQIKQNIRRDKYSNFIVLYIIRTASHGLNGDEIIREGIRMGIDAAVMRRLASLDVGRESIVLTRIIADLWELGVIKADSRHPAHPQRYSKYFTVSRYRRLVNRALREVTNDSSFPPYFQINIDAIPSVRRRPPVRRQPRSGSIRELIAQPTGYRPVATSSESVPSDFDYNLEGPPTSLQGRGNYPNEPVIARVFFRTRTNNAMMRFKRSQPWRGSLSAKKRKFRVMLDALNSIYSDHIRPVQLFFSNLTGGSSGGSSYNPSNHTITMRGNLSVTTFLHEFTHSRGYDEVGATIWCINLFRKYYPRIFEGLIYQGHFIMVPPTNAKMVDLGIVEHVDNYKRKDGVHVKMHWRKNYDWLEDIAKKKYR